MNCKWIEVTLAALIIIFAYSSWDYATWIIVLAAAGILIHALTCKVCHTGHHMGMGMTGTSKRRR